MSTVRELSDLPMDPVGARSSTEEVRVAIALNGGVSLAVWMGGCAVELDAARRALTRRVPDRRGRPALTPGSVG